jgi:hypothetical protein
MILILEEEATKSLFHTEEIQRVVEVVHVVLPVDWEDEASESLLKRDHIVVVRNPVPNSVQSSFYDYLWEALARFWQSMFSAGPLPLGASTK